MSPEQVRGHDIDGRSDLYSLGVALYQCITGEVPFHGESLASMTYMILEVDPRPPQPLNPGISDELADIMLRALQKSPEDRFQNALEFADALRGVSKDGIAEVAPRSHEPLRVDSWTPGAPRTTPIENSATVLLAAANDAAPDSHRRMPAPTGDSAPRAGNREALSSGSRPTVSPVIRYALSALGLLFLFFVGPALRTSASQPEAAAPLKIEPTQPFRQPEPGAAALADTPEPLFDTDLEPPTIAPEFENYPEPTVAAELPAAQRRVPAPRPAVFPVLSTAIAPVETAPAIEADPVRTANLEIVFKNRLRNAEVSVWIDEEKVWSRLVAAPKNLFKRAIGRNVFTLLPVNEGPHVIDVRVIGTEGKVDVVRRTEADFVSGQTKRLKVTVVPPQKLKLSWVKTHG